MNFKKEKYILLFLFLIVYLKNSQAQDLYFSQNLCTRTYLNPAIAGTDSTLDVSLAFARQFHLLGAPSITRFAADQYVRFLRGGIGVDLIGYKAGFERSTSINLNYAPHFELFHHKLVLQPGFSIGYLELTGSTSFSAPNGGSGDPSIPWNGTLIRKFDFSTGIFMYTNKFYGGVALKHLTQPDVGFFGPSPLPYSLNVNVGANLSSNKVQQPKFILSPNIIFRSQGDYQDLLLGITTKIRWFVLGLLYENRDAFVFNAGLQFKYFKLGYSYDMTISQLTNVNYGTHELQLIGFIPYSRKPCKIKTIRFI